MGIQKTVSTAGAVVGGCAPPAAIVVALALSTGLAMRQRTTTSAHFTFLSTYGPQCT